MSWYDPPTIVIRNSVFHNPSGQEIAWDGDPGMPDLAASGNVTADPLFVDYAGGNYELGTGSPAIDAGRGAQVGPTDILGRARHDDLGMINVGSGNPSYVDIGAFERQDDSPLADLAVTGVTIVSPIPKVVNAGDTFDVGINVELQAFEPLAQDFLTLRALRAQGIEGAQTDLGDNGIGGEENRGFGHDVVGKDAVLNECTAPLNDEQSIELTFIGLLASLFRSIAARGEEEHWQDKNGESCRKVQPMSPIPVRFLRCAL